MEDDWLSLLDLDAIADPGDKLAECEFFLGLATVEQDRNRFRWVVSAFLNSAYSFFETSALYACVHITDENGDPHQDKTALAILRKYVVVLQERKNNLYYVKTAGLHDTTKRLYQFRKDATHCYPLSIMIAGPDHPKDFHFGNKRGSSTPAIQFCTSAMELMRVVQQELDQA